MLQDYQQRTLNEFFSIFDVSDKKVLEIGGVPPFSVSKFFINKGAFDVQIININKSIENSFIDHHIKYQYMDARRMNFPDNHFDVIFGVAILEHINNIDMLFLECARVLKPGGHLYLHGGPLWSSYVGHHLYMDVDNVNYRFLGNNPIDPWDHLILSEDQLNNKLRKLNIDSSHVIKIVNQIYRSDFINRLFPEDFIYELQKSKLKIIDCKLTKWRGMPSDVRDKLKEIYPNYINFNVDDIVIYAKK